MTKQMKTVTKKTFYKKRLTTKVKASEDKPILPDNKHLVDKNVLNNGKNQTDIISEDQLSIKERVNYRRNKLQSNTIIEKKNDVTDSEINSTTGSQIEGNFIPVEDTGEIQKLSEYLSGKTVALVANSIDLLNIKLGEYIDSHDIVVRFNSFNLNPEYTGVKLNIHSNIYLNTENFDIPVDYRFIFGKTVKLCERPIKSTNSVQTNICKINDPLKSNEVKHFTEYPEGFVPTTGFNTIRIICENPVYKCLHLFGFTFYENGSDDTYRLKHITRDISKRHDYEYERAWVNKNFDRDCVINMYTHKICGKVNEKYTFTTILNDGYIKGVLALNQSIKERSKYSLFVLCFNVTQPTLDLLEKNGIKYRIVNEINSAKESDRYKGTYTKLHIFNLIDYEKVIYLDSDTIVVKSVDDLFDQDINFGATALHGVNIIDTEFSPGFIVLKPNADTFNDMMSKKDIIESYDGGDQGFLNQYFIDNWYRIPDEYHVTKRIFKHHTDIWNSLRGKIRIIHYPGTKPWQTPTTPFEQGYEQLEDIWRKYYNKVEHKQ